jgi:hypothetical protein
MPPISETTHTVPEEWRGKITAAERSGNKEPGLVITELFQIPGTETKFRLILAEEGNINGLEPGVYAWTNIQESNFSKDPATDFLLTQSLGHSIWLMLEGADKGAGMNSLQMHAAHTSQGGQLIFSVSAVEGQ